MEFNLTLVIILLTVIISVMAFRDPLLKGKCILHPYSITREGEWYRMLTSGFLHADWGHLLINMYVLYNFGTLLEEVYRVLFPTGGNLLYLIMYLSAIVLANISSLLKHRDNPGYLSLGASGAVSAVLFGAILVFPDMTLRLLFLPVPIPAWLMGLLYLIYSVVMARVGRDNINHEAHFYGAVYGFLFTGLMRPDLFPEFIQKIKLLI